MTCTISLRLKFSVDLGAVSKLSRFFSRSIPILTDLLELKKENNDHVVLPSDKVSF